MNGVDIDGDLALRAQRSRFGGRHERPDRASSDGEMDKVVAAQLLPQTHDRIQAPAADLEMLGPDTDEQPSCCAKGDSTSIGAGQRSVRSGHRPWIDFWGAMK